MVCQRRGAVDELVRRRESPVRGRSGPTRSTWLMYAIAGLIGVAVYAMLSSTSSVRSLRLLSGHERVGKMNLVTSSLLACASDSPDAWEPGNRGLMKRHDELVVQDYSWPLTPLPGAKALRALPVLVITCEEESARLAQFRANSAHALWPS